MGYGTAFRACDKLNLMHTIKIALSFLLLLVVTAGPAAAVEKQTYTSKLFLYSIDYPADWRVKEISKVAMFLSPLESRQDKFAENVEVNVEDLSQAGNVSLIDYHRKSIGAATRMLKDFKVLEEAKTEFIGREAIAVLYTAVVKEKLFRFKKVTLIVGKDAYSLTYNALSDDFEKYLPQAEKIMRSLQVSP